MNFKLFQYFIFHCIVFAILVFIAFYIHEHGNLDTVFFGTILYMPYVLILSGLNLMLIRLGLTKMTKRPLAYFLAFFSSILLTIWLLVSHGHIVIRYWKLTLTDFIILNTVMIGLNFLTITRLTSRKQSETI